MKCYVSGQWVFDQDLGISLKQCDLREVATIDWPSGQVSAVTQATGGLKITPGHAGLAGGLTSSCP